MQEEAVLTTVGGGNTPLSRAYNIASLVGDSQLFDFNGEFSRQNSCLLTSSFREEVVQEFAWFKHANSLPRHVQMSKEEAHMDAGGGGKPSENERLAMPLQDSVGSNRAVLTRNSSTGRQSWEDDALVTGSRTTLKDCDGMTMLDGSKRPSPLSSSEPNCELKRRRTDLFHSY